MTKTLIHCQKLNIEAEPLSEAPFPGDFGDRILRHISQPAWQQWVQHQTMLINEYRLSLIDPKARSFLHEEMEKYFFGEGSATPAGFSEKI